MTLIINLLNDLCSFCPRKELWEALVYMLPFFNGSLKNLPIGKRPYQISEWENDIEIGSISNLLYSMKGTDYEVWADRCYRENHRISNLDCFLLAKTDAFLSKLQLE